MALEGAGGGREFNVINNMNMNAYFQIAPALFHCILEGLVSIGGAGVIASTISLFGENPC